MADWQVYTRSDIGDVFRVVDALLAYLANEADIREVVNLLVSLRVELHTEYYDDKYTVYVTKRAYSYIEEVDYDTYVRIQPLIPCINGLLKKHPEIFYNSLEEILKKALEVGQ